MLMNMASKLSFHNNISENNIIPDIDTTWKVNVSTDFIKSSTKSAKYLISH